MTAVLLAAVPLAGCGTPPELRNAAPTAAPTRAAAPSPAGTPTFAPTTPPATGLPGTATPTADSGLVAVPCPAGPSGQRVVDLVRGRGVLPGGARVRVRTGPLCAGGWHYTVLDVTGHEELHVVTEGRASAPRLVAAGTDVCTAEVRAAGPPGIRTLVCDGGSLGVPGA
ncbi:MULTISPECIES: hypothetical protein [unclassified Micromonospora]|uniref:hypothetical protein n=1 Tax=unclassified Micromonospora TaxID=2617518 RepID=UPI00331C5922